MGSSLQMLQGRGAVETTYGVVSAEVAHIMASLPHYSYGAASKCFSNCNVGQGLAGKVITMSM